ncbi:MAG TPA: hypothetical protein VN690_11115, partial [Terriglobales bacterium]|nr:hypothetical protein [Terriglobales bacterium]
MSLHPPPVEAYVREHAGRTLAELQDLLRIPSISTLPAHRGDMDRALDFLEARLREAGCEHIERLTSPKHPNGMPVLYADWLHAKDAPTVLFYGHYDVQP